MSGRTPKSDDKVRKEISPKLKRRRFTEVAQPRERKSPHEQDRHREASDWGHANREAKRVERSRSRSPGFHKKERPEQNRADRRYRETPPREKRKFREERENDEPRKRRRSQINSSPHNAAKAVSNGSEATVNVKGSGQTEFMLNDRFSVLSTNRPLVVEENVSVEIERKIPGREGFKIPKGLEPSAVGIPKSALVGRRSLTLREEFRGRADGGSVEPWRPDDRFGGRCLEKRVIQAGDLSFGGGMQRMDRRGRDDGRRGDRNIRLARERKFDDPRMERQRNFEEPCGQLPDFSKRPGKWSYEAWKDRPEMIPKGRSYFEHDVRDDENEDARRSRDLRGSQWPRGRAPRGRAGFSRQATRPDLDAWKHDKFEEMEAGDQPSPDRT